MRKERERQRQGKREQQTKKLTKIAFHSISKHGAHTCSYWIPIIKIKTHLPRTHVRTHIKIGDLHFPELKIKNPHFLP